MRMNAPVRMAAARSVAAGTGSAVPVVRVDGEGHRVVDWDRRGWGRVRRRERDVGGGLSLPLLWVLAEEPEGKAGPLPFTSLCWPVKGPPPTLLAQYTCDDCAAHDRVIPGTLDC